MKWKIKAFVIFCVWGIQDHFVNQLYCGIVKHYGKYYPIHFALENWKSIIL